MGSTSLHALRSVGDVALRGDGKAILYTETDPSGPYRATSNLMLYDRDSKRSRVFRQSGEGGVHARWSPDGSKVALLGVEGDRFGLIVTDASGGSERFLAPVSGTNHPLPSSGERLAWSPDSSSIAYMSSEPGPESADATGDPVVIRRYLYKPTAATGDTRFNDNRRTHIFFVSASGGSVRQLTEGHFYEHSLSFSPKGNEVLFISNREADPDRFFNYDIFTVGIGGGGETRRLTLTENAEYRPRWSPDGTKIVYQGTRRGLTSSETTMEDTHIGVMDADGSNRRELATIDNRQGAPQWSPDGTSVYFTVQERGSVALYRVPLTGGEGEPIIQKRGRVRGFSLGADGEVAYVFHGEDDFPQLYLGSDKLTDSNRALLAEREVAETVSLRYQSFDGMAVCARLSCFCMARTTMMFPSRRPSSSILRFTMSASRRSWCATHEKGHGIRELAHQVDVVERSIDWYQTQFQRAPVETGYEKARFCFCRCCSRLRRPRRRSSRSRFVRARTWPLRSRRTVT